MCTLWGAKTDSRSSFTEHGPQARHRLRTLHLQPGTEYAYSNANFHILARLIEGVAGRTIGELLGQRIFPPAGMSTAAFCPDTARCPCPCVGYEGDEKRGYVPATNRIEWPGDAGIVASLPDMVAYETFLDRSLLCRENWYYQTTRQTPTLSDAAPAMYGNGLSRRSVASVRTVGLDTACTVSKLQTSGYLSWCS